MTDAPKTAARIPQRRHNEDRLRRADSWLRRSEAAGDDTERFIFLWIAFNAAYGQGVISSDSDPQPAERERFKDFLRTALDLDDGKTLEKALRTCSRPVRGLLRNPYVFAPFWYEVWGLPTGGNWKKNFDSLNESVDRAKDKDTHYVLGEVFLRLYTLRNQILHGGTTFGKKGWGQRQVKDGCKIMASLAPAILKIVRTDIEENPDSDIWGRVLYPHIGDTPG